MEYFNNKLCVSYEELVPGIITKSNYDQLKHRGRITQVRRACYGTPALIDFESLPTNIREACIRKYGNPKDHVKKSTLKDFIEIDPKAEQFFANYKLADGRFLPVDIQEEYCNNAKVLKAIHIVVNDRMALRRALQGSTRNVWNDITEATALLKKHVNHTLPDCTRRLKEKVIEFNKQGYEYLISKKFMNKNSAKVDDTQQIAVLRQLIGHANNFNCESIAKRYNEAANIIGWDEITAATVAKYAKQWDLFTYAKKHGITAFRNEKTMQISRRSASYPFYHWTLDGWDVELYYQETITDANGKQKTTYNNRLTVVVVLDTCLNYPIGAAIGTHENTNLIREALRNAMQHTYNLFGDFYRPAQLQSDHYGLKTLTPYYEAITKHFTAARVHNAKAKRIEPYFKSLNVNYCQENYSNWSGFGIKTDSKKQPNQEHLNKIKRDFPDRKGCEKQIIEILTAERVKKAEKYIELFNQMPSEHKVVLNFENHLFLHGQVKEKTNVLTHEGLVFTINKEKYKYECFDPTFREFSKEDWSVYYLPDNMEKILVVNNDCTRRYVLESKYVQPEALIEITENDPIERKKVNNFNNLLEEKVSQINCIDEETVEDVFANNPRLYETNLKMILPDSRGQHKDNKSAARLNKEAKKLMAKQKVIEAKEVETNWKDTTENYYKSKVNINDYLE